MEDYNNNNDYAEISNESDNYYFQLSTNEQAGDYRQYYQEEEKLERPKKSNFGRFLALILAASIGAGSAFGFTYNFQNKEQAKTDPSGYYVEAKQTQALLSQTGANTIPQLYKNVAPNVVSITSKAEVENFFYGTQAVEGSGTGVVFNINKDSVLIVTNHHVIENAQELLVSFDNQNVIKSELVGSDSNTDLAVIKVNKSDIPTEILNGLSGVVLGDSDNIEVGEMVIAIGNPLGYDDTLTVGFISGLNRTLQSGNYTMKLIQTDAAINPGNSGGALINMRGELIGINSVKITHSGGEDIFSTMPSNNVKVDNMGFAIPVNTVKHVVDELLNKGYVSKPYIGIAGKNVSKTIAEEYNLSEGILIDEVTTNSGAKDAGLKRGDIITDVDNQDIKKIEDLVSYLYTKNSGDIITLTIDRRGEMMEVEVKLKEAPQTDEKG